MIERIQSIIPAREQATEIKKMKEEDRAHRTWLFGYLEDGNWDDKEYLARGREAVECRFDMKSITAEKYGMLAILDRLKGRRYKIYHGIEIDEE